MSASDRLPDVGGVSSVGPFEIVGNPAPQGSKKHLGNGVMVEMAKGHKPWRAAIAHTARDIAADLPAPLDGPLLLVATFRFPMPASRPKRVRTAGVAWKTTAPDTDKLARCLCDGLEAGGLLANDARIAIVAAAKVEVVGWTGAVVELHPLDGLPTLDAVTPDLFTRSPALEVPSL